jgi:hypothetical protein
LYYSEMITRLVYGLLLVAIACVVCFGQENSDDKERRSEPESIWQQVIPVYSFTPQKTNLFRFDSLSVAWREGPDGTSAISLKIDRIKMFLSEVKFSFFIRNTIYGSPGMDGFALPVTSLSINPITGWYWWDF